MSARERNREQLRRLWAVCQALGGLPTPRAKGQHLQRAVRRDPYLAKYLRAVYDPTIALPRLEHVDRVILTVKPPPDYVHPLFTMLLCKQGFGTTENWALMLKALASDEQELAIARRVIRRDLRCSLSLRVVNRVFENLGIEPIPEYPPPSTTCDTGGRPHSAHAATAAGGLAIEVYLGAGDYAHGDVICHGQKTGTLTFLIGPGMRKTIKCLREAGIMVMASPTAQDVEL